MDKLKIQTTPILEDQINSFKSFKLVYQDQVFHVQKEVHDINQYHAVLFSTFPTIIQALIFFIILSNSGKPLTPLTGNFSIASLSIILSVIGSFIVFTTAFFLGKRKKLAYIENIPYRHYPALMVAILIVVTVFLMFLFYLFDKLFHDLTLDSYLSTTLAAAIFTVVNYFVLYFLFSFTTSRLINLLIQLMIGGVVISMITNSESFWWKRHLSMLGSSQVKNGWQFNLTLILSGLLLIALVDAIFITMEKQFKDHRGVKILRYALYLLGFSLAMVGLFPIDGPSYLPFLHNKFAELLVIISIFLMIFNRFLIPNVTRTFKYTSYGVSIILTTFSFLYLTGDYITLTAFEIISFLIAFMWLIVLFDFLNHIIHPQAMTIEIEMESK